jgi:hypothetical protein
LLSPPFDFTREYCYPLSKHNQNIENERLLRERSAQARRERANDVLQRAREEHERELAQQEHLRQLKLQQEQVVKQEHYKIRRVRVADFDVVWQSGACSMLEFSCLISTSSLSLSLIDFIISGDARGPAFRMAAHER